MCGIVAVVSRVSQRSLPTAADISDLLVPATTMMRDLAADFDQPDTKLSAEDTGSIIVAATEQLKRADQLLAGTAGLRGMLSDKSMPDMIAVSLSEIQQQIKGLELNVERWHHERNEAINAAFVRLKDLVWAIGHDRLRTAEAVAGLAGSNATAEALNAFWCIQVALAAIDRLEVRGRDSAGLHVLVHGHDLDFADPALTVSLQRRSGDPLFGSGSIRRTGSCLSFVYKAAAEVGELGDNTAALRAAVVADDLLASALRSEDASVTVLGHTRWASVGMINEANAHPLNSELVNGTDQVAQAESATGPYVVAALNGDVDNHADLVAQHGLSIHPQITTDAKVIPALWSSWASQQAQSSTQSTASHSGEPSGFSFDAGRQLDARELDARESADREPVVEAFRRCVNALHGSVAVVGQAATQPDKMLLALRGSGQALYVGTTEDAYVAASEPYGLVEQSSEYLRMDGTTQTNPHDPLRVDDVSGRNDYEDAARGQIVVLDRSCAGDLGAVSRFAYDGTPLPVSSDEIVTADITTRDIDRRGFRHFLLKEISEAPESVRKTLRGRIVAAQATSPIAGQTTNQSLAQEDQASQLVVRLSSEALPDRLIKKLGSGQIARIIAIGQGTAAVAARSLICFLERELDQKHRLQLPRLSAMAATELSGFGLRTDMSDTLIIAVSQSGTTNDTNRTVDLARRRGASVIAIVNRRNSDLCTKADGVLYTSDGRDVEMSVASTKAFYSQVAAGVLLAVALGDAVDAHCDPKHRWQLLESLRQLPTQMTEVLALHNQIAEIVRRHGLGRTYWAVVGNGINQVAAEEVRIKLSELCYKSISVDSTENKKHIDLSSEPLMLVCAAGLSDSIAEDVSKEVAIFRAHKAVPIVFTTADTANNNNSSNASISSGDSSGGAFRADNDNRADTTTRFGAATEVIVVPATASPELGFLPVTMAGHLFGYESALAIDELAKPLRETRAAVQAALQQSAPGFDSAACLDGQQLLQNLRGRISDAAQSFFASLRQGHYDGCLKAGIATELASVYRYVLGFAPLDAYELERGAEGTPESLLEDLVVALTDAIDQLTRPIDAIRHQAKTVTVGISRA